MPETPAAPSPDDALLAAWIGRNWDRHYRAAFAAIDSGRQPPFNWAAAFMPLWFAWRRQVALQIGSAIAFPLLWLLFMMALDAVGPFAGIVPLAGVLAWIAVGLPAGAGADRLLHARAHRALRRARRRTADPAELQSVLARRGGTSLVLPLLLVAAGWFGADYYIRTFGGHSHDSIYRAAMRADLRNLVTAQELHFAHFHTFAAATADSILLPGDSVRSAWAWPPTTGVTITIGVADSAGWNATARSVESEMVCAIFVGRAPPPLPGGEEGQPYCREP